VFSLVGIKVSSLDYIFFSNFQFYFYFYFLDLLGGTSVKSVYRFNASHKLSVGDFVSQKEWKILRREK